MLAAERGAMVGLAVGSVVGLICLAWLVGCWADIGSAAPRRTRVVRPVQPLVASPVRAPVLPDEALASYPPGTRVAVELPPLSAGIPIGAGNFLPPLNGVDVAEGIPPIRRDPRLGAPGPVVAKQVDMSGQEWWIHADGSQTSCCHAMVTDASGRPRRIVSTQHGAALAGGHGVPAADRVVAGRVAGERGAVVGGAADRPAAERVAATGPAARSGAEARVVAPATNGGRGRPGRSATKRGR